MVMVGHVRTSVVKGNYVSVCCRPPVVSAIVINSHTCSVNNPMENCNVI